MNVLNWLNRSSSRDILQVFVLNFKDGRIKLRVTSKKKSDSWGRFSLRFIHNISLFLLLSLLFFLLSSLTSEPIFKVRGFLFIHIDYCSLFSVCLCVCMRLREWESLLIFLCFVDFVRALSITCINHIRKMPFYLV